MNRNKPGKRRKTEYARKQQFVYSEGPGSSSLSPPKADGKPLLEEGGFHFLGSKKAQFFTNAIPPAPEMVQKTELLWLRTRKAICDRRLHGSALFLRCNT